MATHVHLVGSVALDSAQDVFSTAGKLLGPYLERVPDGEPGGRRLWISWQIPLLRANPSLQVVAPADQTGIALVPLRLATAPVQTICTSASWVTRVKLVPPSRTFWMPAAAGTSHTRSAFRCPCRRHWR